MKLDCGDNSCYFMENGKGGMRTNGGCRCFNDADSKVEIRKRLQLFDKMERLLKEIGWTYSDDIVKIDADTYEPELLKKEYKPE